MVGAPGGLPVYTGTRPGVLSRYFNAHTLGLCTCLCIVRRYHIHIYSQVGWLDALSAQLTPGL